MPIMGRGNAIDQSVSQMKNWMRNNPGKTREQYFEQLVPQDGMTYTPRVVDGYLSFIDPAGVEGPRYKISGDDGVTWAPHIEDGMLWFEDDRGNSTPKHKVAAEDGITWIPHIEKGEIWFEDSRGNSTSRHTIPTTPGFTPEPVISADRRSVRFTKPGGGLTDPVMLGINTLPFRKRLVSATDGLVQVEFPAGMFTAPPVLIATPKQLDKNFAYRVEEIALTDKSATLLVTRVRRTAITLVIGYVPSEPAGGVTVNVMAAESI